jgi:hypothetical protein
MAIWTRITIKAPASLIYCSGGIGLHPNRLMAWLRSVKSRPFYETTCFVEYWHLATTESADIPSTPLLSQEGVKG